MLSKLSYMRTRRQNFMQGLKKSSNERAAVYNDKYLGIDEKPVFKHSWAQMAHMHDQRVWMLAYAPTGWNGLRQIQEIHRLNAEMWYQIAQATWKRILAMIAFYVIMTKFLKHKYMIKGQEDTHDTSYRDTTGLM